MIVFQRHLTHDHSVSTRCWQGSLIRGSSHRLLRVWLQRGTSSLRLITRAGLTFPSLVESLTKSTYLAVVERTMLLRLF